MMMMFQPVSNEKKPNKSEKWKDIKWREEEMKTRESKRYAGIYVTRQFFERRLGSLFRNILMGNV